MKGAIWTSWYDSWPLTSWPSELLVPADVAIFVSTDTDMALLRSSIYILWYPNTITDALDRMYLCTWLTWCPNHVMFGNFGSVGLWNTRLLSIFGLIQWNLDRVVQHSLCYPNHTQWTKTVMIMVHCSSKPFRSSKEKETLRLSACRGVSGGVIWAAIFWLNSADCSSVSLPPLVKTLARSKP